MGDQDQSIYTLQEAIILTNSLAIHSRSPYLVKYYNFLTRSLTKLLQKLREAPAEPKETLLELLCKNNNN